MKLNPNELIKKILDVLIENGNSPNECLSTLSILLCNGWLVARDKIKMNPKSLMLGSLSDIYDECEKRYDDGKAKKVKKRKPNCFVKSKVVKKTPKKKSAPKKTNRL